MLSSPSTNEPTNRVGANDPDEASRLEQYEIVWVAPHQYWLPEYPDGFGLEIQDFLGRGDPDPRGRPTVWVRGPVVAVVSTSTGPGHSPGV